MAAGGGRGGGGRIGRVQVRQASSSTRRARWCASSTESDNLIGMESHISATEAARNFSDIVSRVRLRQESFVVERAGEAVCRIVPVAPPVRTVRDLVTLLQSLPRPDAGYLLAVEQAARRQPKAPKSPWAR